MKRTPRLLALVLLAAGCSEGTPLGSPVTPPSPPPPPAAAGVLSVRLATPHADDGALLLELRGPAVREPTAAQAGWQLFAEQARPDTLRIIVAGDVGDGALMTFRVPDGQDATTYSAVVLEVADRRNAVRSTLTGYGLTITRD